MNWLTFVAGAVLSWGVYGAMLHQGQTKLGSPMRALLCVGIAYFLIGVLVPVITMMSLGQLDSRGWNSSGATFATVAGALGAIGAACIIFSFRAGGLPTYVMPLVFGGAPLVNVLYTMAVHPPKTAPNPLLYVGFLVTAIGAAMVLQAGGIGGSSCPISGSFSLGCFCCQRRQECPLPGPPPSQIRIRLPATIHGTRLTSTKPSRRA
jgi:hypothetical protein